MNKKEIKTELKKHSDSKYKKFSSSLLPGVEHIMGVRLPDLRSLARRIAHSDWRKTLPRLTDDTFEEIMLQGMVIGYIDCPVEERLELIRGFIPKIDNWSVCDSFIGGLKFTRKNQERVFSFLQPYISSKKEYEQRFAAVMLLNYFIDEIWLFKTIQALEHIDVREYYAKMAVAWAMAECYLHYPNEVMPVLKRNSLDREVQLMALQKIIESRTITPETREQIRLMKKQCR